MERVFLRFCYKNSISLHYFHLQLTHIYYNVINTMYLFDIIVKKACSRLCKITYTHDFLQKSKKIKRHKHARVAKILVQPENKEEKVWQNGS